MFRSFFRKEKIARKEKTYSVIVHWYHDTPWYLNCTARDIEKFEADSEVERVDIIG